MPLFVLCSVIYAIQYSAVYGINSTFWRFKSNDLLIVLQKTISKMIFFLPQACVTVLIQSCFLFFSFVSKVCIFTWLSQVFCYIHLMQIKNISEGQ